MARDMHTDSVRIIVQMGVDTVVPVMRPCASRQGWRGTTGKAAHRAWLGGMTAHLSRRGLSAQGIIFWVQLRQALSVHSGLAQGLAQLFR